MRKNLHEKEDREKEDVINLLNKQIIVEGELVRLYKETEGEIKSRPVKHLLRMIELDSRKHIDICHTVIDILQGEELVKTEKEEVIQGLKRHIELEKESIDRANEILRNDWIRETSGLTELIKKLKDDEEKHHMALIKLTEKPFIRLDPSDLTVLFRDVEWLENREKRSQINSK